MQKRRVLHSAFSRRSFRVRAGFTLIELLTVITIIGILAAIIIPTVGKVRRTAKEAQATSNIRQVAVALITSANEYKNFVPGRVEAARELGTGINPDTGENYNWYDLLQKNISGNLKSRNDIHLNPLTNYDPRADYPNLVLTSQWAPNPYAMPESQDMIDTMAGAGGRLSLANAPTSRVMLLSTSPGTAAFKGVAQSLYLCFWGRTSLYMNRLNWTKVVPITSAEVTDQPGGIGYDLGGSSRTAALFAFMDGHVARVQKGAVGFGQLYQKN